MLRQFIAILILSAVLLQTFSKVIIVADYLLNKDYIAKNLCVKKEVINNCCKGKCHLKKQLEKDDKKEKAPASQNFKDKNEVQFFSEEVLLQLTSFAKGEKLVSHYFFPEFSSYVFSVFHPPAIA